jgi:hypothetical protein
MTSRRSRTAADFAKFGKFLEVDSRLLLSAEQNYWRLRGLERGSAAHKLFCWTALRAESTGAKCFSSFFVSATRNLHIVFLQQHSANSIV